MTNPYKDIATRIVNAENDFAEVIANIGGCDIETGHKVRELYMKNKLAKMDAVSGKVSVKHGAFLDDGVVKNAIEMVS